MRLLSNYYPDWFLSFVALLRTFYQILTSYCKFIMTKALKWGMLHLFTLIFHYNKYKNALKSQYKDPDLIQLQNASLTYSLWLWPHCFHDARIEYPSCSRGVREMHIFKLSCGYRCQFVALKNATKKNDHGRSHSTQWGKIQF